ncbi:Uma2 family endonuclease [Chroococcidiopsis sp. FACHB-1243]|uniref:Uma2 family endonuclease n=1 Tax=Chroococcidiopsis sp. [FACHB-1243] TaxID=2692781 RepID=UPI0017864D5E|nr:Uma2 family endonuclease [Chroococcidiopsis sp. [FACHB-1243]]MBD2308135.1 Uma2 family endonuclease [Chroococcidiopsis sp. [FACHB-1243]]
MTITELRLWTVDEYHRMIEADILTTKDRVELLEGQIIQMSPQQPPHAATIQRTFNYLNHLLVGIAFLRMQLPITLYPNSEPEPDIAVVRINSREYIDGHPTADDIFLLIEVADKTLSSDRTLKARIYAQARIAEYWIVDVNARQVYVLREPGEETYQQETILGEGDKLSRLAFPKIEMEVNQMFL